MSSPHRSPVSHNDLEASVWKKRFVNYFDGSRRAVVGGGSSAVPKRDAGVDVDAVRGIPNMREEYVQRSFSPAATKIEKTRIADYDEATKPDRVYPLENADETDERTTFRKTDRRRDKSDNRLSQSAWNTSDRRDLGLPESDRLSSNRHYSDKNGMQPYTSITNQRQIREDERYRSEVYENGTSKNAANRSISPQAARNQPVLHRYRVNVGHGLGVGVPVDDDGFEEENGMSTNADNRSISPQTSHNLPVLSSHHVNVDHGLGVGVPVDDDGLEEENGMSTNADNHSISSQTSHNLPVLSSHQVNVGHGLGVGVPVDDDGLEEDDRLELSLTSAHQSRSRPQLSMKTKSYSNETFRRALSAELHDKAVAVDDDETEEDVRQALSRHRSASKSEKSMKTKGYSNENFMLALVAEPEDEAVPFNDDESEEDVRLSPSRAFGHQSGNRPSQPSMKTKGYTNEKFRLKIAAEPHHEAACMAPRFRDAKTRINKARDVERASILTANRSHTHVDDLSDATHHDESLRHLNVGPHCNSRRSDHASRDGSSNERSFISMVSGAFHRALATIPLHRHWTILRKSGNRNEEAPQAERIRGIEHDQIRDFRIELADEAGHSLNSNYLSLSQPPAFVPGGPTHLSFTSQLTSSTPDDFPRPSNPPLPEVDGRYHQPQTASRNGSGAYYRDRGLRRFNSALMDMEQRQKKDRNRAMPFSLVLSCLILIIVVVVVSAFVLPMTVKKQIDGKEIGKTSAPSMSPSFDGLLPPSILSKEIWTLQGDFYIFPQNDATRFGRSVSLDSSGSAVAIASLNTVVVKQYSIITNSWTQIGPDFQGRRVSISGDGRTIAVQTSDTRLQVYFRSSGQTWQALGNAISIDSVRVQSLALSTNGLVLAVGGVGFNSLLERSRVMVYSFDRANSLWTSTGGMIDTAAGVEVQVALSVDGTILGTATRIEGEESIAFESLFFKLNGRSWRKITDKDVAGSVSVGLDKAVLGSPGGRLTSYVFATNGLVRREQMSRVNTAMTPQVAVSTDVSVVAACWESHVEVWHRTDENWVSRGRWSENSGLNVTSISLASDGKNIAIGVAGQNTGGFVGVFSLP